MGKRLYVGNLPYSVRSNDLQDLFAQVGEVVSVKVVTDMETGRSKGFAFVEMESDELGAAAIEKFNGQDFSGRALKVIEANPRPERPAGGNRFGGNREGGFSRGGGNREGGFSRGGGYRDRDGNRDGNRDSGFRGGNRDGGGFRGGNRGGNSYDE